MVIPALRSGTRPVQWATRGRDPQPSVTEGTPTPEPTGDSDSLSSVLRPNPPPHSTTGGGCVTTTPCGRTPVVVASGNRRLFGQW